MNVDDGPLRELATEGERRDRRLQDHEERLAWVEAVSEIDRLDRLEATTAELRRLVAVLVQAWQGP